MSPLRSRLALLVASLALSLLAAEVALALLGFEARPRTYPGEHRDRYREHFVADPDVGWRMRPGARFRWTVDGVEVEYEADGEGFRGGPGRRPTADGPRIALVGDSFLWGFGVPWEASCGRRLEERLGVRVDNLAMPGFGLDQIGLALRHWALPRRPDLIVAGLFLDDFNRSFHAFRFAEGFNKPAFRLAGDRLVPLTAADRPAWPYRALERGSRLFTLVRRADRRAGRELGRGQWWTLNEAILDALRRDAHDAGVPLLFLHIPYREPIPFPTLDAYMRRTGADYLGLPPWSESQRRELFFESDLHLNADGHAFLAEALDAWIREHRPERLDG